MQYLERLRQYFKIELFADREASISRSWYASLLVGMEGAELGAPSPDWWVSGLYDLPSRLDYINYAPKNIWNSQASYPRRSSPGKCIFNDITNLHAIPDSRFEFVFSNHVIEHIVNPLKALSEISRVVRPGGLILTILPNKDHCFDHRRPYSDFSRLYKIYMEERTEADCMDLVAEMLPVYDFTRDPGAGGPENFIMRCKDNANNHALHAHVYNIDLYLKAALFFGLIPKVCETIGNTDLIILCKKPDHFHQMRDIIYKCKLEG